MTPPTKILDQSIGGFSTIRLEMLKNASREGGSSIPASWSSNKSYAELANEGLVAEHPAKNALLRCWKITDAGRAALREEEQAGA